MSGPNQKKPGGKKPGKRSHKPEQLQSPKPEQPAQLQSPKPERLQSAKPERLRSPKPEKLQSPEPEKLQSPEPVQLLSPEPEQPRSPEPEQLQSPEPVQLLSPEPEQLQTPQPEQLRSPEPQQLQSVGLQDSKKQADAAVASATAPSIDFQTLATAYGNYTKKSFEETKAFVEKLSGARSLDKAVEIQIEFAKQAYETFVTESQKIRELYRGLAKETYKPFEGFVAKKDRTPR
jgi:hypothetical protein